MKNSVEWIAVVFEAILKGLTYKRSYLELTCVSVMTFHMY